MPGAHSLACFAVDSFRAPDGRERKRTIPTQLLDQRAPVERAILVGAPRHGERAEETAEHLAELTRLADTAGGVVVGELTQRIRSPSPRLYIGEGKADELGFLTLNLILYITFRHRQVRKIYNRLMEQTIRSETLSRRFDAEREARTATQMIRIKG